MRQAEVRTVRNLTCSRQQGRPSCDPGGEADLAETGCFHKLASGFRVGLSCSKLPPADPIPSLTLSVERGDD